MSNIQIAKQYSDKLIQMQLKHQELKRAQQELTELSAQLSFFEAEIINSNIVLPDYIRVQSNFSNAIEVIDSKAAIEELKALDSESMIRNRAEINKAELKKNPELLSKLKHVKLRGEYKKIIADYVYFIENTDNRQIKIGTTKNVDNRLKTFRTANPNVQLIGLMYGDRIKEREIHERFKDSRISIKEGIWAGEWFYPSPELKAFIEMNKAVI